RIAAPRRDDGNRPAEGLPPRSPREAPRSGRAPSRAPPKGEAEQEPGQAPRRTASARAAAAGRLLRQRIERRAEVGGRTRGIDVADAGDVVLAQMALGGLSARSGREHRG